jgi:hypothetical protein|tara:strand:- start:5989 stop:6567 length:579 start_codon:yes stop_codon:yes gene_type:complete
MPPFIGDKTLEEKAMLNRLYYLLVFGIILALSRILPHPPNFTPIIASAIMAPLLIRDRWFGIAIPIFAMLVADIVIGFHPYQTVIYLTLIVIGLVAPMQRNIKWITAMAILGPVWFFLTTNFAVWLAWDYYPKTIEGLILCYTMAIPFFQNTLISTCLFTGVLTLMIKPLEKINEKTNNMVLYIVQFAGHSK